MPAVRRLAAILAADVAGYSRLMGADEEGTHARLQVHRRELVDPKIREHFGRIVKTTGDGVLAEFPSVVDAVRCAAEIQRGMIDREPDLPDERRIRFRIGVNLGDVIAEDNDIFGDGVNVAARLEALAEPGGICISRMVRDQIRDKLVYPFGDLGEQSVKNIARPVRVYALHPAAVADLPAPSASSLPPISPLAVAPRLSIVVLPFGNLSKDQEQQYFADGITEDLTTDLSRIPDMFVISRNTAFTYQGKRVDTKQIGRELGVRYLLEGSVRRSGNLIRVNAQLIDAQTDAHLWAERFDGDTSDLFALQDEVTGRIAIALGVELIAAEAARPTEHSDALDYILRGRATQLKPHSRNILTEAISLYERALSLDPESIEAETRLAGSLMTGVIDGMSDSAAADLTRAEKLVDQALAASPRYALAHVVKGQVLRARGRYEDAISEYETAYSLDRNLVNALAAIGRCKIYIGAIEEGIAAQEQAIRLSPRDPLVWNWYYRIGEGHLALSHVNDAILWLEKARNANPAPGYIHTYLASAYAIRGETDRAAAELAEARRLSTDSRFSSIARLKAAKDFGGPKVRTLFEATLFRGLRLAGMPEE
jgi:adenylate cyclase